MESGANISIHGKYGETPIDLAKAYGKPISSKTQEKRSTSGSSPQNSGNQKIVNLLNEHNADVYKDERGCFLLHEAVSEGKLNFRLKLVREKYRFIMHTMVTFTNQVISEKYVI